MMSIELPPPLCQGRNSKFATLNLPDCGKGCFEESRGVNKYLVGAHMPFVVGSWLDVPTCGAIPFAAVVLNLDVPRFGKLQIVLERCPKVLNRYSPYWESSGSMGSPNEMMA